MPSEKTPIRNRHNKRVVVVVDHPKISKGLAFVVHGLSGNKEEHLKEIKEI